MSVPSRSFCAFIFVPLILDFLCARQEPITVTILDSGGSESAVTIGGSVVEAMETVNVQLSEACQHFRPIEQCVATVRQWVQQETDHEEQGDKDPAGRASKR